MCRGFARAILMRPFCAAFIGQEFVTYNFFTGLGIPSDAVLQWMSGPAFLPWFRMNNFRSWLGPLTPDWIKQQYILQIKVLAAMRELGMKVVLPGWAGHVPEAIRTVFPSVNLVQSAGRLNTTANFMIGALLRLSTTRGVCLCGGCAEWAGFNSTYSQNVMIATNDSLYVELGKNYTQLLIQVCLLRMRRAACTCAPCCC